MSSTAAEVTALGSTTTIDLDKRLLGDRGDAAHDLFMSKLFTVLWGLVAVGFAAFAALLDNLIEAVNILGSNLGFLWYNVVGRAIVVAVSVVLETVRRQWRGAA